MTGTKKQTSEAVLKKLIKHWPGYIIEGSKPYTKGAKIYQTVGKLPTGKIASAKLVQTFPSNDAAFLTMTESVTKNNGWYPGKDVETPLFGAMKSPPEVMEDRIEHAMQTLYNNARKARDLRTEADLLFEYLMIDPLDKDWKNKINKILNTRRNDKKRKGHDVLGTPQSGK